jgi:phosphoglycolate phosphatase-like HAD superfamily hydrolase
MADLNMAKNTPCRFLGVKTGLYNDEFINKCDNIIVDNFTFLKVEK